MSACRVHSSVAIYTVPGPQVLQSMQYKTLATSKRDGILDKFKIQGKEQSSIREMSFEVDLMTILKRITRKGKIQSYI